LVRRFRIEPVAAVRHIRQRSGPAVHSTDRLDQRDLGSARLFVGDSLPNADLRDLAEHGPGLLDELVL
jgi:hypothetical protein